MPAGQAGFTEFAPNVVKRPVRKECGDSPILPIVPVRGTGQLMASAPQEEEDFLKTLVRERLQHGIDELACGTSMKPLPKLRCSGLGPNGPSK